MSSVVALEYLIEGGGSVVGRYPRIPNKRWGVVSWVVTLESLIKGGGSVVGCCPRIPNRRRGQCRGLLP